MSDNELLFAVTAALNLNLNLLKDAELRGYKIPSEHLENISKSNWFFQLARARCLGKGFTFGDTHELPATTKAGS